MRVALVVLYARQARLRTGSEALLARNLAVSFAAGAGLWLISAAIPPPARYVVWCIGLAIDIGAPIMRRRVLAAVPVDPNHLPERFGLFIIIVFGEAVVTTGAALVGVRWDAATLTTAISCFFIACLMWWSYFEQSQSDLRADVHRSDASGIVARDVYSYGHFPIVLGIAFTAAGARMLIGGTSGSAEVGRLALSGGVAGFFLALAAIQWAWHARRAPRLLRARVVAVMLLVLVGALGRSLSNTAVAVIVAAIGLLLVTGAELLPEAEPG